MLSYSIVEDHVSNYHCTPYSFDLICPCALTKLVIMSKHQQQQQRRLYHHPQQQQLLYACLVIGKLMPLNLFTLYFPWNMQHSNYHRYWIIFHELLKYFTSPAVLVSNNCCSAGRIPSKSSIVPSAYESSRRHYYSGGEGNSQHNALNNGTPGGQSSSSSSMTPKEYLDRKSGLTTFGIISIIFVIIVACLAFYYGIICYPLLCRDEKKYYTDGSSTITAATSCSIQSIDNYPDDHQKHMEQKNVY